MRVPSTGPIATTCSSASAEAKYDVVVGRDPASVVSKVNTMRVVGSESILSPSASASASASANESSTSNDRPSSTFSTSHIPPARSPCGPVMW